MKANVFPCPAAALNQKKKPTSLLLSSHLFGPLQLVVQCLFGDLHLDNLLSEQLVLVLGSAAFVLHTLQLVVQTHRHVFGHLRYTGTDVFKNKHIVQTDNTKWVYEYFIYVPLTDMIHHLFIHIWDHV